MIRSLAQALAVGKGVRRRTRLLAVVTLLVMPLASLTGVASASAVQTASPSPSAAWWIWAAGLHQIDPTDPTCGVTGKGPLFFVSELTSSQDCTVAPGQQVLAAVINFEWSKTEAGGSQLDPAFPAFCRDTEHPAALLACANWQAGHVTATSATLDGRRLPVVRLTAPAFTETWAVNNYFMIPPGPTPAAAAGYYVLLPPLTRGSYRLVVSGTVTDLPGVKPNPFTLGATIQLHQE